jgi:hypothetical protein
VAGVVYAIDAAACRTAVLLVTRYLVGADARLSTWYAMLSWTIIFVLASSTQHAWTMPQSGLVWTCLIALSLAATAALLRAHTSVADHVWHRLSVLAA